MTSLRQKALKLGAPWLCAVAVASSGAAVAAPPSAAKTRPAATKGTTAFSTETVVERARALAARPYVAPPKSLPKAYSQLNYDQYRDIRFRPEKAHWRDAGLPFQVQFFHPGFLFQSPVVMNVVEAGRSQPLRFSQDLFSYGKVVNKASLPRSGVDGFAGLRFHHPLNNPDIFDELAVFQGASYFRSLGQGNLYGLSARGIAIDTAQPSPEEFPEFREFWLERPADGANLVVVHALMDGPSITGAYRFTITPGANTVMEVQAALFSRRTIENLGVAPLTSMYLFGENDRAKFDDFRPEVHDSDGLLVWSKDGEQLWRPLQNPRQVRTSSFRADNPRAFGLLQRDTAFHNYEDLEARYERRPSAWVEPVGEWGAGAVRLVEIPTPDETHDNIVAFWVPDTALTPGTPLRVAYRLHWGAKSPWASTGGVVTSTRITSAITPGMPVGEGVTPATRRFILDFSRTARAEDGPVEAVITTAKGQVLRSTIQRHEPSGGWRTTFELEPEGTSEPIELRAFLRRGSETLTETWSYLWIP